MNLRLPSIDLKVLIATTAVAAIAFAGGAYWNHEAGTAVASEDLAAAAQGFLGLSLAPVTDAVAARLSIPKQDGLAVLAAVPDGPAAKAGVQRADVIKSIKGTVTNDMKSAMDVLKTVSSGDKVDLSISRGGALQTIIVTAGDAPVRRGPRAGGPIAPGGPSGPAIPGGRPGMPPGAGIGGFGMMPNIPELQGIPLNELFDHVLSGSLKLRDKDGKDLTITITAGKVTTSSDTSVTIAPNGGGSPATFGITADTKLPGKGSALKADTKVVVITKNNSSDALAIHPLGMMMPHPGVAGFGPGASLPGDMGILHGMMQDGGPAFDSPHRFPMQPFAAPRTGGPDA